MTVDLLHGNCLDILPTLPDCSVDSIVTDPPYELGFMGKKWDNSGIAYNVTLWQECLRVLKPGGHLLAFGGTRTYHRMACAIEDAGFEIRDSIHWLYGSGFPKSLDVSKAIDKRGGNANLTKEIGEALKAARKSRGITASQADRKYCGGVTLWSWYEGRPAGQQMPTSEIMWAIANDWPELRKYAELIDEAEREIIGKREVPVGHSFAGQTYGGDSSNIEVDITVPATEQAKQWAGWGTALKPAHEPIVVARKPLVGTVASNVLEWGTGAINIDASRIPMPDADRERINSMGGFGSKGWTRADGTLGSIYEMNVDGSLPKIDAHAHDLGRWPANVILTHTDTCTDECVPGCPVALLDEQSGTSKSSRSSRGELHGNIYGNGKGPSGPDSVRGHSDSGGASRFFYCAKPSRRERNAGLDHLDEKTAGEATDRQDGSAGLNSPQAGAGRTGGAQNHHPTVKPLALMRYLVRLVTPPNGTVLEPFAGSGTTLMAAILEGFHAIGIEMTDEYLPIIQGRIAWAEQQAKEESPQQELEL